MIRPSFERKVALSFLFYDFFNLCLVLEITDELVQVKVR